MQSKRILFIHPNFPGQFKGIAQSFADYGHDVAFLCQTHYGRTLRKVKRLCLKGNGSHEYLDATTKNVCERSDQMAYQFLSALTQLKSENWYPDVTISHSGWGCGLFVKNVWPHTRHISYMEWWFDVNSELFSYDENNIELNLGTKNPELYWVRNKNIALELSCCDLIVAPSKWQKQQLPANLQTNTIVIYDGLDDNVFKPKHASKSKIPKLTYGTRGMEPIRAFPQFIREVPKIIKLIPDLTIEIAGRDEINYSGMKPKQGSWKKWAIEYLEKENVANNISWKGFLDKNQYPNWLRSSWCHTYLTHPFVTSWSLVEALACGSSMICSNIDSVREFSDMFDNPTEYVDHRKDDFLANPVLRMIENSYKKQNHQLVSIPHIFTLKFSQTKWGCVSGVEVATTH